MKLSNPLYNRTQISVGYVGIIQDSNKNCKNSNREIVIKYEHCDHYE